MLILRRGVPGIALLRNVQIHPLNSTILPNGWNFAVPHGEYGMGLDGQVFRLVQGAPHVSVSTVGARTVLWAGYHRCYARAATVNPATVAISLGMDLPVFSHTNCRVRWRCC